VISFSRGLPPREAERSMARSPRYVRFFVQLSGIAARLV
jgi:hypothetical protein